MSYKDKMHILLELLGVFDDLYYGFMKTRM